VKNTAVHEVERIGWLVIESGRSGTVSRHAYRTGLTPDSVTHNWYTIGFGSSFSAAPRFVAMIQRYDDADNCHLRYNRTTLTVSGATVATQVGVQVIFDRPLLVGGQATSFALEGPAGPVASTLRWIPADERPAG
jgi:hypothetical protein